MFRRSLSVKLPSSTAVVITCLGAIPAYAEIFFVTAGDNQGLQTALNSAKPSSTIVINQPEPGSGTAFVRQSI